MRRAQPLMARLPQLNQSQRVLDVFPKNLPSSLSPIDKIEFQNPSYTVKSNYHFPHNPSSIITPFVMCPPKPDAHRLAPLPKSPPISAASCLASPIRAHPSPAARPPSKPTEPSPCDVGEKAANSPSNAPNYARSSRVTCKNYVINT